MNLANLHNVHDGRVWTYNTQEAWGKLFPYLTRRQIQKNIKKLADDGILLKGNYNKNPFDKTAWYSLNEAQFQVENYTSENDEIGLQPSNHRLHDMVQSDARYGAMDSPKRCNVTDNKQQIIINNSSKPAEAVFDFDLVLVWIINQLTNVQQLTDLDKIFIEGALHDYHDSAEKPRRAQAFTWVEQALKNRLATQQRSAKASAARDNLNNSVKNQLTAQAAVIDQHNT